MKKIVSCFITFVVSLFVGVFLWDNVPYAQTIMRGTAHYSVNVIEKSCQLVRKVSGCEQLQVFERKWTPEQVLSSLTKSSEGKADVELAFVPHTLMHVRFSQSDDKKTVTSQEGQILWNLANGEMVLNTDNWSYSKGLRECLTLKAKKQDIHVMQTLAILGGAASKESLSHALSMKNIRAEKVIRDCQKKKLIFAMGDQIKGHFQQLQPIQGCTTTINASPVWLKKPHGAVIIPSQFSEERVSDLSGMIFGKNFLVLGTTTVYVPVYKVSIKSEDNSVRVKYVNAMTGELFQDL